MWIMLKGKRRLSMNQDEISQRIGSNIQRCREELHLSKSGFASKIKMSKSQLSEEEFSSIQNYTKYQIGSALNKAIRNKAMSKEDVVLKDRIVSAISKHKLKAPVITYRGIVVSKDVYEKNFLARYIFNLPIDGSLICSTSREYGRASTAAKTKEAGKIGIIFCCELPKGYPALPVEGIAKDKAEREILISAPRYEIEEITNCRCGRFVFKRIKVKIIGDKNEN